MSGVHCSCTCFNWPRFLFTTSSVNPFVPNAPFLYPLKTSENSKVFRCFEGVEKRCIGNKWVKVNALLLLSNCANNLGNTIYCCYDNVTRCFNVPSPISTVCYW